VVIGRSSRQKNNCVTGLRNVTYCLVRARGSHQNVNADITIKNKSEKYRPTKDKQTLEINLTLLADCLSKARESPMRTSSHRIKPLEGVPMETNQI